MSQEWLTLWALLLSCAWLMPNHFPPWAGFHADAWMALALLIGAAAVLLRVRTELIWHSTSGIVAILVLVPWTQFSMGLLPFAGQAWMSSLYLLGLLLALLMGARWEKAVELQLPNALFLAIGFASVVSVWLQFATWLNLFDNGATDIWSMGLSGDRPYANIGQPNNLATLLIWGVLACLWAYLNKFLIGIVAIFVAVFLLSGIALTQSRMGILAITVTLGAIWFWRHLWPSRRIPWIATGLYAFFCVAPFLLQFLHSALLLGDEASYLRLHQQGELRLGAWNLFLHAIAEKPWLGYGWTEVHAAQLAVADKLPGLGVIFAHSHNLFLDFALWLGLPLGLLISGFLIHWLWTRFRAVKQAKDAVLFLVISVIGIHAMVELPLHYAYFLLPTGLFIGVINTRTGARTIWISHRWILTTLCITASLAWVTIVHDYFRVEASYNFLRFEQARIGLGKNPTGKPPDILMLTQLREWIRYARFETRSGMSPDELEWMSAVTRSYPSASTIYQLATALALNNRPEEALIWLGKVCKITTEEECSITQQVWQRDAIKDPRTASIKWPQ